MSKNLGYNYVFVNQDWRDIEVDGTEETLI